MLINALILIVMLTLVIAPFSYFIVIKEYPYAVMLFLGWSYVAYQQRHLLSRGKRDAVLVKPYDATSTIDSMYQTCLNRDRTQSFDDWVNIAIQTMAIDEIESGNTNQELTDDLKEKWGSEWDTKYPPARVEQELSKEESYWTALKKFDDKVAKDLGEEQTPPEDGIHESETEFLDGDELVMMDAKANTKNGVFHGEYTITDANGVVRLRMFYVDGKQNGMQEEFASNGEPLSRTEFVDDEEHGLDELYDHAGTGRLVVRGQKVNGLDHGDFEYLDEDGSVFMTITYENGEEVSTVRSDN